MSFSRDEFDEIIKTYRERRWNDLHEILQNYDSESIAAAEGYLGVKFADEFSPPSIPRLVGEGQGKMKKFSKKHSKKWFSKKIKQTKNKEEKDLWKATKAVRLAELRESKKKATIQKLKERTQIRNKTKLEKLIRTRESLKRQARRYGIKVPRQANLANKRYKYIGARTKALKKSNSILKKIMKVKKK